MSGTLSPSYRRRKKSKRCGPAGPPVVLLSATLADANPTVLALATPSGCWLRWCSSWA